MRSHSLQSFREELVKIAATVDADTRNNMAQRHETTDFLLEGRLDANDSKESYYFPKVAISKVDLESTREDAQEKYRDARKPASAALKGGLVGTFAGQTLTGGNLGGEGWKKRMGLRGFAAVGAGLGLADHYAQKRYKKEIKKKKDALRYIANKKQTKTAMMGSTTFTPGRALTTARNTGSFQDKLIHKGDRLRPATIGSIKPPTQ